MMVFQTHFPSWEVIVSILCHPAKSLQATTSLLILILIIMVQDLDSNWYIMQQVRAKNSSCMQKSNIYTFHKQEFTILVQCENNEKLL